MTVPSLFFRNDWPSYRTAVSEEVPTFVPHPNTLACNPVPMVPSVVDLANEQLPNGTQETLKDYVHRPSVNLGSATIYHHV